MKKNVTPSPYKERLCDCGCNNLFLPKRKDQRYLNSQHANYHYNNTKRIKKDIKISSINKSIIQNNKLLGQFYKTHERNNAADVRISELLKSGFAKEYFIGVTKQKGIDIFHLYDYVFYLNALDKEYITIKKI